MIAGCDRLMKKDFPRVQYRPMASDDAQEKLIEWKLRQSTTKLKTTHAAFVKDYISGATGHGELRV